MANVCRGGLIGPWAALVLVACSGKESNPRPPPPPAALDAAVVAAPTPDAAAMPDPAEIAAQVVAYVAAYDGFSEELRTRTLAIKAAGRAQPDLQAKVDAVIAWARQWDLDHRPPTQMGPPLRQGEFPDKAGLRPSPNLAFDQADVEAALAKLQAARGGDLDALFGTK